MCGAENNIFLYIAQKTVTIVLIPDEYHQFRTWYKFIGINFTEKKHIGFIAKNTEVQCFGFVTQEDFLRCF